MGLFKKVLKISNLMLDNSINKLSNEPKTKISSLDDDFFESFNASNERIRKIKKSIQHTKLQD